MSQLLLYTPLNPEQRQYVDAMRISADHLLVVINDILDFSKMESGQMRLNPSPLSIQQTIEEAIGLSYTEAFSHLDVIYQIDDKVPASIWCDCTRLRQILVNLLSNALRFTMQGGVTISVKLVEGSLKPEKTCELQFSVKDSGLGIPQDKFSKLFQLFSQVETGHARSFGGTGLGLVISHRLVNLMHGSIWVESMVGVGSVG